MSSERDFERLLGEARETLPGPDEDVTERAREMVLAAAQRRPHRMRVAALLGACLAVAIALAVGAASVAPSGTASRGPVGLGFVPEPGWFAFQTGGQNGDLYQTVAVAANVPLHREDQVAGAADPSGLPYATLLELPSDGIVIVATFTKPSDPPSFARQGHELELPLGIRDATPYIQYGTQLRPEEPLGQYEIRGQIRRHYVNVHIYFGSPRPSPALLREAHRQLTGIVIRRGRVLAPVARVAEPAASAVAAAPSVVDRTVTCVPSLVGGIRQVDTLARGGSGKRGSSWDSPALASVRTTVSGAAATAVDDNLVWVAAGPPSSQATVVSTLVGITFPMRSWGTVAVNRRLCRTSPKRIPLSRKGLSGGAVGPFADQWDCAPGRRVVVRVRAVVRSRTELASYRGFLRTTVPVKSAVVVVATQAGKTLSYAEVLESGKSRLYVAPSCFPD
jgi:hypothetical protein